MRRTFARAFTTRQTLAVGVDHSAATTSACAFAAHSTPFTSQAGVDGAYRVASVAAILESSSASAARPSASRR